MWKNLTHTLADKEHQEQSKTHFRESLKYHVLSSQKPGPWRPSHLLGHSSTAQMTANTRNIRRQREREIWDTVPFFRRGCL